MNRISRALFAPPSLLVLLVASGLAPYQAAAQTIGAARVALPVAPIGIASSLQTGRIPALSISPALLPAITAIPYLRPGGALHAPAAPEKLAVPVSALKTLSDGANSLDAAAKSGADAPRAALNGLFESSTARSEAPETPALSDRSALGPVRRKLYELAGGGLDSGHADLARLDSAKLLRVIRSREFGDWVSSEKAQGKRVFWLTDLDKTMAAGDIFTFFFAWRAANGKFTPEQNEVLRAFLKGTGLLTKRELARVERDDGSRNAAKVLELWRRKEEGGGGIGLLDFWRKAYWPSQVGMTPAEKSAQVRGFASAYAAKIFPGAREQNEALKEAGVEVVIVSNGDQELAQAVAPLLSIDPRNTVGAALEYGKNGLSTGRMHTYEIYDETWAKKPQPGKPLNFLYWVHNQRARWPDINRDKIVVAAMFGDSASADGGPMIFMNPALGFFMVNTPGEPGRLDKFLKFAHKYGGALGRGSFITVDYAAPASGAMPEIPR